MKGKAIIGIAMATNMLASVFATTVPMVCAEGICDNAKHIIKQVVPQKVLIGQDLQFKGFATPLVVYDVVWRYRETAYVADDKLSMRVICDKGDCDGDGKITSFDALCALQMAVGKRAEDLVIEVKGDGSVISVDTQEILRIAEGLEEL